MNIQPLSWKKLLFILLLGSCLSACPEADFFFASNADQFTQGIHNGGIIIISIGSDDTTSANIIEGQLPQGLILQDDGTIEGIPEETGLFEVTVETMDTGGMSQVQTVTLDIGD